MGAIQIKRLKAARPHRRWAVRGWLAVSAMTLTACGSGFFGGDEAGEAAHDVAEPSIAEPGEEPEESAEPEPEPEVKSVVEVPSEPQEPVDAVSDQVEEVPVAAVEPEPPEVTPTIEDEADIVEQGCWWETEQGADVFSEYTMANVVCMIPVDESAGSDVTAGALDLLSGLEGLGAVDPTGVIDPADAIDPELLDDFDYLDLLGNLMLEPELLEARFGWRCSVGVEDAVSGVEGEDGSLGAGVEGEDGSLGAGVEGEDGSLGAGVEGEDGSLGAGVEGEDAGLGGEDDYEGLESELEVFASNGRPPRTLQFASAADDGAASLDQVAVPGSQFEPGADTSTGQSAPTGREAAVLVRFGSDPRPLVPKVEVVVTGRDLDSDIEPSVENQKITYEGLWRNSAGRPPRDRAGVLSVLEDRNYDGRYDEEERELSKERSRHDEHLLYAPDDLVDTITEALMRDTSGMLYTAVAGIYIDFDISGWQEHVGPVLEACGVALGPVEASESQSDDDATIPPTEGADGDSDPSEPNGTEGEGAATGPEVSETAE